MIADVAVPLIRPSFEAEPEMEQEAEVDESIEQLLRKVNMREPSHGEGLTGANAMHSSEQARLYVVVSEQMFTIDAAYPPPALRSKGAQKLAEAVGAVVVVCAAARESKAAPRAEYRASILI
nr:hypothetical protein CFP56_73957 [Quercus suber]